MRRHILLPLALLLLPGGCSGTISGAGDEDDGASGGGMAPNSSSGSSGKGAPASGGGGQASGGSGQNAGGTNPGSGGGNMGGFAPGGGTGPGGMPPAGGAPSGGGSDAPGSGGDGASDPGSGGLVVTPGEHGETLTMPGGTGAEPGGEIPICCVPSAAEKENINRVFELLNAHRANNGLAALRYDEQLEAAVLGHCHHMIAHDFFAHDAPEAAIRTPWTRAELCGSRANGENIAQGQRSPEAVMEAWTNSSGHNQNMLNRNFTRVGIAFHDGCWGQLFGTD